MNFPKKRSLFVILLLLLAAILALCAGVLLYTPREKAGATTFFGPKEAAELRKADPAEIAKQEKYSSRDYGILTTVKNQGGYSLCWAYATIAASETSILREGVGNAQQALLNLEERNLAYWAHNPRADEFGLIQDDVVPGNGQWNKGGYVEVAGQALLQWLGPVKQFSDAELDMGDDRPEEIAGIHDLAYKLEGFYTVPYSVEGVKRLVAEYGAAAFSFPIHTYDSGYYDIDKYFNNDGQSSRNPHACIIVGWDDTIPASSFRPKASGTNGGWIVKNSWGKTSNDEGYFYLSYDSKIYDIWAFDYTTADAFDHQYLYNGSLSYASGSVYGEGETVKAAAIYRAQGGTSTDREVLNAVNIGIGGTDVAVKVSVYTGLDPNYGNPKASSNVPDGGKLAAVKETTVPRDGYYTVYLDTPVSLENGESFSVVVEAKSGGEKKAHIFTTIDYSSTNDMTFEYKDEESAWSNLQSHSGYSAHIRAYTKNVPREEAEEENDLQFARMTLSEQTFTFCGEAIEPEVTVTLGGTRLELGRDYELRFENNFDALGNARVYAVGKGNYTGTCCGYFQIQQAQYPLNRPKTDINEPIVVGREVTHLGQIPLPEGWRWYYDVDFNVYYDGMLDRVSEWAIEYVGADKANYKITQTGVYVLRESTRHDLISLDGAEVSQKGTCVYTGKVAVPEFTVSIDGTVLTEGIHYTVQTTAVNAGNAVAEITGIDNYTGTVRAEFVIRKAAAPAFSGDFSDVKIAEGTRTLRDVSLPSGWQWQEGETPLIAGEMRAVAEYVGADRANFETLTREVVLTVSAETVTEPDPDPNPNPEPDPDPKPNPDPDPDPVPNPDQEGNDPNPNPDTGDGTEGSGCAAAVYGLPVFTTLAAVAIGLFVFRRKNTK